MTTSQFYQCPEIISAFGRTRVFEVCRHVRAVWPGFPSHDQPINNYHLAWLIFILSYSKKATHQAVYNAIQRGRELKCEDRMFISWLGDTLFSQTLIEAIQNIYVFYEHDNVAQVTHKDGTTKIFQGSPAASTIRRAAILSQEFLLQLHNMLQPAIDESLESETVFEADDSDE